MLCFLSLWQTLQCNGIRYVPSFIDIQLIKSNSFQWPIIPHVHIQFSWWVFVSMFYKKKSLQTFWKVLTTIIQVQVKLGHVGCKWSPSYFFTFPPCKHIYISCLHRNVQINVSARKSKFQTKDIKVCWDSHIHNIQLPMFSLNNTLMFWSFDFPFEIEMIFKSFAFWPPWKMGEHRPNCRHNHFLAIYFYPMLAHISSAGK